ncbi:hypothetical protein R7D97_16245 [Vibrio sp. Vb5031]|uniref:Uncharacterized protein n=1 Tax=Vibrio hepatarius TaxID=171383 RepID=A0A0M0HY32_9VIBR|nr:MULTISPECIES: hypothetical protein [Vibrio]KOO06979.1 hypothetical protein AKJ31_14900 [Vibrio hepatarius]MCA2421888.1 hypothetical protein [Vibrio alginolyticus]MCA2446504.1 hypothetical protein [Vibrio alginolyticus]MCR9821550.1 hypothetical protein [Vibrio parahaemolyticus]MDF5108367.1 hypothetical protein [Vibrio parahaemolyticus]
MTIANKPQSDFFHKVEELLQQQFGIGIDDVGPEMVESCFAGNETPAECVGQLASKYELDEI